MYIFIGKKKLNLLNSLTLSTSCNDIALPILFLKIAVGKNI